MVDSSRDLFAGDGPIQSNLACGSELRPENALDRAANLLNHSQSASGCWSQTVFGSVRTTAEYVLLHSLLKQLYATSDPDSGPSSDGQPGIRNLIDEIGATHRTVRQAAAYIASQQSPTGAWTDSADRFDLNTTSLAYLALRVSGHHPDSDHVARARTAILSAGGLFASDPLIHYWYAIMGEVSYDQCRPLPIELSLLSHRIPGSLRRRHLFRRVVLTSIGILAATRPSCAGIGILTDELPPRDAMTGSPTRSPESATLFWTDRLFKWRRQRTSSDQTVHPSPIRKHAITTARRWLCDQVDVTSGVGGDVTATIWTTLGLIAISEPEVPDTTDAIKASVQFLESASESDGSFAKCGLAKTDVRTSAVACQALGATGMTLSSIPMQRSVDWLLERESHRSMANLAPSDVSGWSTQGGDTHFVDAETTAIVLLALREQFTETPLQIGCGEDSMVAIIRASSTAFARRQIALLDRMAAASRRSRHWLRKIQNADGGWGRYVRGGAKRRTQFRKRSFDAWGTDLVESDASSPVVTSLVIEALASWDQRREIDLSKAIGYLRSTQQADGRWADDGTSIHPTARAIQGLIAAGLSNADPEIANAVAWLTSRQQKSGAWRDTPWPGRCSHQTSPNEIEATSSVPTTISPPRTSSKSAFFEPVSVMQTSSAILALIAAGVGRSSVVERGVAFLQQHQQSDGGWGIDEFACNFRSCCEHGYDPTSALAYPILALAAWNRLVVSNGR